MKIENGKNYNVDLYMSNEDKPRSYGRLPGEDVKRMLKGCKYDNLFGMWFTPKANKAYDVTEVE